MRRRLGDRRSAQQLTGSQCAKTAQRPLVRIVARYARIRLIWRSGSAFRMHDQ